MRTCVALQTVVALVLALLLAPFQHVHAGADHDHDGIVHAHFYHLESSVAEERGPHMEDPDDDHAMARSLDTFTLVITTGLAPFVLSRGPELLYVTARSCAPWNTVEERGNSPPPLDTSIPRAPPA